jgi:plasmid stabilization system protein ParE
MASEIKWSRRSDVSFDRIIDYLNSEWGENVTKVFIRKVYDFLDILSEFPEIGALQLKEKGIRGFTITKQITIFYKINRQTIIILDFFDTRQDPEKRKF